MVGSGGLGSPLNVHLRGTQRKVQLMLSWANQPKESHFLEITSICKGRDSPIPYKHTHTKNKEQCKMDKEYPSIKVNMCRFALGPRIHTQLSLLLHRGIEGQWYKRNKKNKRTKGQRIGQSDTTPEGAERGQDENGTGKRAPDASLKTIGWMQDIQNDSFFFFFFLVRRALVVPSSLSSICPSGIIISAPCQPMARLSSLSARCPRLQGPLAVNIGYLCAVSLLLMLAFVLLFGQERDKLIGTATKG